MQLEETRILTGQALVDAMIARDDSAWRIFLEDFGPLINGLCRTARLDTDEIDDIVQSIMVKLLDHDCRALRHLKVTREGLYQWFKVVVSRAISDFYRHQRRRKEHEAEWVELRFSLEEEKIDFTQMLDSASVIDDLLAGLSDEERTLFWFEYRGVRNSEIVRVLGLQLQTVQKRLSRLRKKLRKLMIEKGLASLE